MQRDKGICLFLFRLKQGNRKARCDMKYPFLVIRDGVEYPAGVDVPTDGETKAQEKPQDPPKNADTTTIEYEGEEIPIGIDKVYKKTEIMRMSIGELRTIAKKEGIVNVGKYTGAELKKMLIRKFGL